MTDDERVVSNAEATRSSAVPKVHAGLHGVPTLSAVTAHLSFAAAANQFSALKQFGSDRDSVAIQDGIRAEANKRKEAFLRDGALAIDGNGLFHDYLQYSRAVDAIHAKALALGYGAQSQSVPITSVPGGYVGRFGGHDIYAAA